jgi:hypothetical protein
MSTASSESSNTLTPPKVVSISTDINAMNCGSIEIMSLEEIEKEIEFTWYRHLELRNEVYEKEMGPSDILDVYISCQTSAYPASCGMNYDQRLMESNFQYHMNLRDKFYNLNNRQPPSNKQIYM